MRKTFLTVLVFGIFQCGLLQAGAQQANAPKRPPSGTGSPITVEVTTTFSSEIPCADCPGQRITVTLFPDKTFRMRTSSIGAAGGKDDSFYDLGRWIVEGEGKRLVLHGGKESAERFEAVDSDTIRQLTNEGKQISSAHNYDLKRSPSVDPIDNRMRIVGEFIFLADAGVLKECLTGTSFPVAQERDSISLERAYMNSKVAGGSPLLVSLEGHFENRPPIEGIGKRDFVIVEKFERTWPGETCASGTKAASAPLKADARRTVQSWMGKWIGPEGTYLILSKSKSGYLVKIRSLDGMQTFKGRLAGERIRFTRAGKAEHIRAGTGMDTGMKWLLDKKDCLVIKTGEGFCRD
jgi:copper homeostasis protein (lipoprotein)